MRGPPKKPTFPKDDAIDSILYFGSEYFFLNIKKQIKIDIININIVTIKNVKIFPSILQLNSIVWKEFIIIAGNEIYNNIAETVFAWAGSAFPVFININAGIM